MVDNNKSGLKHVQSISILFLLFVIVFLLIDIVSIYGDGYVVVLARYSHYIYFMLPVVVGYRAYQIESYCNSSISYKILITSLIVFGSSIVSLFLYIFLNTKVHLWMGGEL